MESYVKESYVKSYGVILLKGISILYIVTAWKTWNQYCILVWLGSLVFVTSVEGEALIYLGCVSYYYSSTHLG